jgi:hypothetical protein
VDGALLALTHEEEPLPGRLLSHRPPLVVLGKEAIRGGDLAR